MRSIKTKITALTVCVILIAMTIVAVIGVFAIRNIGNRDAEHTLLLLCQNGQKDLDSYFRNVENSVETVSSYVGSDLDGLDDRQLKAHMDRVSDIFQKLVYNTNGVLTYYYRIDPEVSRKVKGFWYVNTEDKGFQEHEVTDISEYDTEDTSSLVWFTVPKSTGKGVWLPPYTTENLDTRVISYNVPVYYSDRFVGVIGIELDYSTMAEVVDNIKLYDNGYAFLNDEEGDIIYHPRMDEATMQSHPKAPEAVLTKDKFYKYTYDGVDKQAVWLPLSNGMRLNVTVPVEEISADWRKWNAQVAAAFVVVLIVFILLTVFFMGRIANLNEMAYEDALTGIRNRLALRHDYDQYQGQEVTVMMVDLNDFKGINDTRGHEEGDRILRETGRLLAETFGGEHSYRYGGDEFMVIVPDMAEEEFHQKLDSMMQNRPSIDGEASAGFSVGVVRGKLSDSNMLRQLISSADEKMYETKRDDKRTAAAVSEAVPPALKTDEYTVEELRSFLDEMSGKYSLARVVDPIECRIIELQDNGEININESCYGIWNAEQKCINCSSALACRTGCHQEKAEHFQDNYYFIQSNPVKLKLSNGSLYDAVVELVNVEGEAEGAVNNRDAENIGTRAAHYLAHHDSLTNVLNADAFYELGRGMINDSAEHSWVMITSNIMNFRLINNLFGVQKGNEVLTRTASLLREISEEARGLCGRLGGDQFALLIPRSKYREEALTEVASTLAEIYNSGIFTFCIHFGVYEIDDSTVPVSVMCGRANSALRTIRDDLTLTVEYFNSVILEKILLEQTVLGSFEEALQDGQFRMYLQPLVQKDGKVLGAEALARWHRPDGTILMPGEFIEPLETAGLIHKLDRYMWEQAVKRLRRWKGTAQNNLAISVNVSAKDFFCIDVAEVISGLVDQYGIDSHLLRLEITETFILGNPEQCDAVVAKLRQKGFLVEIDDFGKDNSSLSFLKDVKADVLKIDMSFLHEISTKKRSRVILQSVIHMADSLGMEVITEGVETEEQLHILTEMGCSHFQGYYFSKPIPVEEFESRF